MTTGSFRFDDAAAYERMMGTWSRLVGERFLEWLAPPVAQSWLDVGCGNGAFTELIVASCSPRVVHGVDPSEAQIAFARARPAARPATFELGDAMALPCRSESFDAAVMALVIFFVPDPPQGVAEMARAVRAGGVVSAYAWDILGGGFPVEALNQEMRAIGLDPPRPPRAEVSTIDALRALWIDAGLADVETTDFTVHREYADFDEYWEISMAAATVRSALSGLAPAAVAALRTRVAASLPTKPDGRIVCGARANAVKGRKPG